MKARSLWLIALLSAAGTAATGCSKNGSLADGRHSWTKAGGLRVAVSEEPKTLNPLLSATTTEGFITRLMFEPLLSADGRGNPVPMLAAEVPSQSNGGISTDGLTIRYRLRGNSRCTDGAAVPSHDVVWSWRAIRNPNNDVVSRHGYDDVRSIDTPDAHTLVIHLRR